MCGIYGLIEKTNLPEQSTDWETTHKKNIFSKLRHRGPDACGVKVINCVLNNVYFSTKLLHTRLAINGDLLPQPIVNYDKTVYLIINGEIFNWHELEKELGVKCEKSDCEIILYLYEKFKNTEDGMEMLLNKLNGQFSFLLYDTNCNKILIARDCIGVTPLYVAFDKRKFVISSEMKCLYDCKNVSIFPPRKYIYSEIDELTDEFDNFTKFKSYYDIDKHLLNPDIYLEYSHNVYEFHKRNIKSLLSNSVEMQLRDLLKYDSPDFGVLLSGGLDSSLIASLVVEIAKKVGYTNPIKTFSIGVNSEVPDLKAAKKVAKFLGTSHYEFTFSIEEGLDALSDVVWYTETYDCTTIRASTPMYLLIQEIHNVFPKLKVLFSGELSDELFCYLYGANAPTICDYQNETVNLVKGVHQFDCLRANKTALANSVETRVPFTDMNFVNYVLSMNPIYKIFGNILENYNNKNDNCIAFRMEKQILRDSFVNYLPDDILYRKKEQFSDGVSGFNGPKDNWIDAIKAYTDSLYSDSIFSKLRNKYIINPPNTKEELYFRELFELIFSSTKYDKSIHDTINKWKPKWSNSEDPSGRLQTFWEKN